jgi:hypothetical protein
MVKRPGDWECLGCKYVNFGSRAVCGQCGLKRVEETTVDVKQECPVCCMEGEIFNALPCGHQICQTCVPQLGNKCPCCGLPFLTDKVLRLY